MKPQPLLTAALLLLCIVGCSSGPSVGTSAPTFSATDTEGNTVTMAAFEDQVLILDFWAVW